MATSYLECHPTKTGYFIDSGFGEPICKSDHILNFDFQEMSVMDDYRIIKPFTYDKGNRIDMEREEVKDSYVRIKMTPREGCAYSYIGSTRLVKDFYLIIHDFNDHMSNHEYPHIIPFPYFDDFYEKLKFSMSIYLEPSHKENIIENILDNKVTSGCMSFSFPDKADVLFQSDIRGQKIPNDFLLKHQLNAANYKYVSSHYPTKILPTNFIDRGKTYLEPYDTDTPIREFGLTFAKTVINSHIDSRFGYSRDHLKIIEEHQLERMNTPFDNTEKT